MAPEDLRAIVRRQFLRMIVAILGLAALALGARALLDVPRAPMRTQILFTAVWMLANLLVVLAGLARIRAARLAARRARASRPRP